MIGFYGPGTKYPGPQDIFRPHPEIPTETLLDIFLTKAPELIPKVPKIGRFYLDIEHVRQAALEALKFLKPRMNTHWNVDCAQRLLLGDASFVFKSHTRSTKSPDEGSHMPLVRFGEHDFLTTCPTDHRVELHARSKSHTAAQVSFNGLNVSSGKLEAPFNSLNGNVAGDNVIFLKSGRSTDIVGWRDWEKGQGRSRAFLPYMSYDDSSEHIMAVFEVYGYELTPAGQVFYERSFFENLLADLRFLASQPNEARLFEWHLGFVLRAYFKSEEVAKLDNRYDHLKNIHLLPNDIRGRLQAVLCQESSLLHELSTGLKLFDGNMLRGGAQLFDAYYRPLDADLRCSDLWKLLGSGRARVYVVSPKTFEAWVGVSHQDALGARVTSIPPMKEPATRPAKNPVVPQAIKPAVLPPIPSGFTPYSAYGARIPMGLPPIAAGANGVSGLLDPDADDDLGPYGHILAQVVPPSPFTETDPDLD